MDKSRAFKGKIINDPLYGFISINDQLIFDLIEHPYFQRLRRIGQLGMASMVYPGALHTRFHHALGAMHLMGQAIDSLKTKGFELNTEEILAAKIAILLHDIGHGPFSHALEHQIINEVSHEEITLEFLKVLNHQYDGKLSLAISIFDNTYPRRFLHQMVSGQLDMDRLDYLMRDSFYTGVSEGVISTDRILKMLTVSNDELAVELKGIYSIEKFIVARRLMYWQVYYHKTVLAAEYMLISIMRRAKFLAQLGKDLPCTENLHLFLKSNFGKSSFYSSETLLHAFSQLDDYDIYSALKLWSHNPDSIISSLCKALLSRQLFRVIISSDPIQDEKITSVQMKIAGHLNISEEDCSYYFGTGEISNSAYDPTHDRITVIDKLGNRSDISGFSEQLNIAVYNKAVSKYFIWFPKWAEE